MSEFDKDPARICRSKGHQLPPRSTPHPSSSYWDDKRHLKQAEESVKCERCGQIVQRIA